MTYTEEEISQMLASRNLDKLVYSLVFKWNLDTLQEDSVPMFSTKISASWRLLEYLKNKPCSDKLNYLNISYVEGKWLLNFRGCQASCEDLSLAICHVAICYSSKN